jgi:hypothetical protein
MFPNHSSRGEGAGDEAHGSIENARSASFACENTYPEDNFKNKPFLKYSVAGEGWGQMSQHIKKGTKKRICMSALLSIAVVLSV